MPLARSEPFVFVYPGKLNARLLLEEDELFSGVPGAFWLPDFFRDKTMVFLCKPVSEA